ncbi:MAG TPA: pur operon repressor [Clostridiales bacterium]|nr:pur operon repressor [Clostridiales bacterium]
MGKIKRNERIGAMIRILTDRPNHIFNLNEFSKLFSVSKSTISEDIVIIRDIMDKFSLGKIETITGAAGGVKFIPKPNLDKVIPFIKDICNILSEPGRILPGGFVYMSDILYTPSTVKKFGEILAWAFRSTHPDFVITVETKGIPVAMATAEALDCPMVIARRDSKATEGPVVTINYISASSKRIQTMSLARRAVKEGQCGLIVDDFMKGGGTAKGLCELLREFNIDVAGIGVVVSTYSPAIKMVRDYKSIMVLREVDEMTGEIIIEPAGWLDTL